MLAGARYRPPTRALSNTYCICRQRMRATRRRGPPCAVPSPPLGRGAVATVLIVDDDDIREGGCPTHSGLRPVYVRERVSLLVNDEPALDSMSPDDVYSYSTRTRRIESRLGIGPSERCLLQACTAVESAYALTTRASSSVEHSGRMKDLLIFQHNVINSRLSDAQL